MSHLKLALCATLTLASWTSRALAQAAPLTYNPQKLTLAVPRNLQGVLEDPTAKRANESLQYEIQAELYPLGTFLPIQTQQAAELAPTNAWGLVRRYLGVILSGRSQDLKPLMSTEAWETFSKVDPKAFAARASALKRAPRFSPLFAIDHKGAVLLHWLDAKKTLDLLPMRRKSDGTYEIHPFHAGQDPTLGNVFQYAFYRPEPPRAAKLTKTFSTWKSGASTVLLEAQVSQSQGQILILRDNSEDPTRPLRVLGVAKDGTQEESMMGFVDLDPRPGKLRFKMSTSELLATQPYELYAVELNYPTDGIPQGAQTIATRWKVTPP